MRGSNSSTDSWLFANYRDATSHGTIDLRECALRIVESGVQAADPGVATKKIVRLTADLLEVDDVRIDLHEVRRIFVIGAGKGSYPIVLALEQILGDRISGGVLIAKSGEKRRLKWVEVIEAGHPLPDEQSLLGGQELLRIASGAGKDDLVLAAFTGGTSSLINVLPLGISLPDLRQLNELLLHSGDDIVQMNTVRRKFCLLKGGGLIRAVQPARTITFTLDTAPPGLPWPDVCLPDPTTYADAIEVLTRNRMWSRLPHGIQEHLNQGVKDEHDSGSSDVENIDSIIVYVGSPRRSCEAAAERARILGFEPHILATSMDGEARDIGYSLAAITNEVVEFGRPFEVPTALITGGEATVGIAGDHGEGGPNQELVLAFVQKARSNGSWACVSVDTDGTDGPTEWAGAIADDQTRGAAESLGIDIDSVLRKHDSLTAVVRLGNALRTGHTGTNVMNLRVIIIGKGEEQYEGQNHKDSGS